MEDARARFAALLAELGESISILELQEALEEEILDLHRERFPRRKAVRNKIPLEREKGRWAAIQKMAAKAFPEDFERICDEHQAAANEKFKQQEDRRDEIREEMNKLAEQIDPQSAEEAVKLYEVGTYTYSTQGFGAATYARGDAMREAQMLERFGIEVEIREIPGKRDRWGIQSFDFEVWAKCTKLDYEIAKRKPAMTIKDQLQWYWNRGLNPRVFNAFLPHGLEEKLGVSYQPVRDSEGDLCP